MATVSSARRLTQRYFAYAYHPIVTKLAVSFAGLGLLALLASSRGGRTALIGIHAVLSADLVPTVMFLAILFGVSTLSPFFPEFLVTVASGFILGVWPGSIFAIAAIAIAASGNFFIARRLGQQIIQLIFDLHSVREIRWTASRVTPRMVFLTWLLPSINFDLISYAAGLSRMSYRVFLGLTLLGNFLSSVVLAFLGQSLRSDQATVVALTLLLYTAIGTALYVKELPPWFEGFPSREAAGDGG
jgi:uncharacterized membrane protein YdjX (TVP38/TMEM64 family)